MGQKERSFEVPTYLPSFEKRNFDVGVWDPDLVFNILDEAKAREMSLQSFGKRAFKNASLVECRKDGAYMALRSPTGDERMLDFMDIRYQPVDIAAWGRKPPVSIQLGSSLADMVMQIANRHNIEIKEVCIRMMHLGLDIAKTERTGGNVIVLHETDGSETFTQFDLVG